MSKIFSNFVVYKNKSENNITYGKVSNKIRDRQTKRSFPDRYSRFDSSDSHRPCRKHAYRPFGYIRDIRHLQRRRHQCFFSAHNGEGTGLCLSVQYLYLPQNRASPLWECYLYVVVRYESPQLAYHQLFPRQTPESPLWQPVHSGGGSFVRTRICQFEGAVCGR